VGADDGGIDVDVPVDQALGLGPALQFGEDPLPGAVTLPPAEEVAHPAPWPYSTGMSRQGMPVRTRNRMPSISEVFSEANVSAGSGVAVNRIKKIKRQIYGRAGFHLLRKMILLQ